MSSKPPGGYIRHGLYDGIGLLIPRWILSPEDFETQMKWTLEDPYPLGKNPTNQLMDFLRMHVVDSEAETWEKTVDARVKAFRASVDAQYRLRKLTEHLDANPGEKARLGAKLASFEAEAAAAKEAAAAAAAAEEAAKEAAGPLVAAGLALPCTRDQSQVERVRELKSVMKETDARIEERAKALVQLRSRNLIKSEEYQSW